MAAAMQEVQQQVVTLHDHNKHRSNELAAANQKIAHLMGEVNNANQKTDSFVGKLREMESAVMNLISRRFGGSNEPREEKVSLINVKTMAPKAFDGK